MIVSLLEMNSNTTLLGKERQTQALKPAATNYYDDIQYKGGKGNEKAGD